jgi:hypothetical protein
LVVLGALAGELGVDDGMLFGMRFLPCLIVWPFMAQWCVFGFEIKWMCRASVRASVRPSVSHSHLAWGSTCVSWVLCVLVLGSMCACPAYFDSDNVHTGVCVIGLGYWNGQINHT